MSPLSFKALSAYPHWKWHTAEMSKGIQQGAHCGQTHCGMLRTYLLLARNRQQTNKATRLVRTNLLCHSPSLHWGGGVPWHHDTLIPFGYTPAMLCCF